MRRLLTLALVILSAVVSLGQEMIYWPEHEGMTGARWSPDGNYIATWGESSLVRIWSDHDGSLALELDHSSLPFILPNGEVNDITDGFRIRGVTWSEDYRYIITYAQPDDSWLNYFQVFWKAETGEHVFTHFWGVQNYYSRDYRIGHEVVQNNGVVATWYRNELSFVDFNPASASIGQEIAKIHFGALATFWEAHWNVEKSATLFILRSEWHDRCDNCDYFFELFDTDLNSDSFGEVLWQRRTRREPLLQHVPLVLFTGPKIHDLVAILVDDSVELWNLDRDSDKFGKLLLTIPLDGDDFHSAIYDAQNNRLVLGEVLALRGQTASRARGNIHCKDYQYILFISVWNVDPDSPSFGEGLIEISQAVEFVSGREMFAGARFNLNSSGTQIHMHSLAPVDPYDCCTRREILTALDMNTGKVANAADIVFQKHFQQHPFLPTGAKIDFDTGISKERWYIRIVAIHPAEDKVIVHLDNNYVIGDKGLWLMQNTETREYFFPPDQWTKTWGEG